MAEYAADLFKQGFASHLIFSGGFGTRTGGTFTKPEAEVFADIALTRGVPADKILIENRSTNTCENVQFTRELLQQRGFDFRSFILVQKPYMERRTYATFKKLWSGKDFIVTSPPISYQEYPTAEISRERIIGTMVGDLQRIKLYPDRGFQVYQEIPSDVWHAYEQLIEAGYTDHLIKV